MTAKEKIRKIIGFIFLSLPFVAFVVAGILLSGFSKFLLEVGIGSLTVASIVVGTFLLFDN